MDELVLREEVYAVVGAAIEVHRELGAGFLEAVYQEAMERELATRGIAFEPQRGLVILYKGQPLGKSYVCDLLCFDSVLVELKAMDKLTGREEAQIINLSEISRLVRRPAHQLRLPRKTGMATPYKHPMTPSMPFFAPLRVLRG